MPRYIDADALIRVLDAKADMAMGTPKEVFLSVVKMIDFLPTADVVPRAEVDELKKECDEYKKHVDEDIIYVHRIKSEVAREIFDDIERLLFANRIGTILGIYYRTELKDCIAELKKKYTEEE